jgi:hypothetical protein
MSQQWDNTHDVVYVWVIHAVVVTAFIAQTVCAITQGTFVRRGSG